MNRLVSRRRWPPGNPRHPVAVALVIGMGPVGRAVASRLETLGYGVSVVDSNPLNLQVFAQQGFKAVAGDAQREHILQAAGLLESRIVVICVPIDEVARTITQQAAPLERGRTDRRPLPLPAEFGGHQGRGG